MLAVAALQGLLAAHVGLGDDEAMYWSWARELGGLTVDHPPLVAAMVATGTALVGDSPLGVRLPFLLCGVLTSAVLGAWVRRVHGDPSAAVAMVAVAIAPLFAVGHVFAAPDMPLWLATACAGLALDHALDGGGLRAWAAAGLAVGVGLWAKLTMGLLPLGVLGLLLLHRPLRERLRGAGPWLAAGLALAIWSPWLVQQAGAGWPGLRFHLVERHGTAPGLMGLLGSVAGQLGYISPVLAGALVLALCRPDERTPRAWGLPMAIAGPPVVVFTLAGAFTRALPHWGGAGWLAALVPGAALLAARPRWAGGALGLAGLLTPAVHVQAGWPVLPLGPADAPHDLPGWPELRAALQRGAGGPDGPEPGRRHDRGRDGERAAAPARGGARPVHALRRRPQRRGLRQVPRGPRRAARRRCASPPRRPAPAGR